MTAARATTMPQSMPVAHRVSFLFLEKMRLERDGHAVIATSDDGYTPIPVGRTGVVLLGPGCSATHAAVDLCAQEGVLLLWVGEHGVRLYATANPRSDGDALLRQAGVRLNPGKRLAAARAIWREMFGEDMPAARGIDQLRGLEGYRVRGLLPKIARECGVEWSGRDGSSHDPLNQAINVANSTLYGLCEAVILALGYSPAIGVIHSGDPRSFVFDVADTIKFQTVVPLALRVVAESVAELDGRVRRACRDLFFEQKLADRLVSIIDGVFDAADRA